MRKMLVKLGLSLLGSGWLRWLLEEYVFPQIDKFVESTDNDYDNEASKYVKSMLLAMADKLEKAL